MSKGLIEHTKPKKSNRHLAESMDFFLNAKKSIKNSVVGGIYPFSNEYLTQFFKQVDVDGKSVLTVGSSGDQMLSAIMNGAKKVTLIDGNPMTLPFAELKLAAIKNLDFDEFVKYFSSRHIFDHKYYAKVSHDLSPKSQEFWDEIMMQQNNEDFFKNMFQNGAFSNVNASNMQYYYDKSAFEKIKKNLDSCKVDFITADFVKFPSKVHGKYDLMMFSNILDYSAYNPFIYVLKKMSEHLTENGKMQAVYEFRNDSFFSLFLSACMPFISDEKVKEQICKFTNAVETGRGTKVGDMELIYLLSGAKTHPALRDESPTTLLLSKGFFDSLNISYEQVKDSNMQSTKYFDEEMTTLR